MPKNFRFSKVNAGRVRKSNKFDLSHSLLGSMGFGDVIPTFCKLMIPQSSLKGNITSSIRVQPMPLPPFGKCGFHQYGQFVGITSLWKCFPEFIAQKVYNGSNKSYVPSTVPYMACMGKVSFFSQLMREKFCVWGAVKYSDTDKRGNASTRSDASGHSFKLNSTLLYESDLSSDLLNTLCGFLGANETRKDSTDAPYTFVSNGFGKGNRVNSGDLNNPTNESRTDLSDLIEHGVELRPDVADFLMLFTKDDVKKKLSADYDRLFPASDTESSGIAILGRWTNEGRNLVRILQGLGINISPSSFEPISLLPLFAFYKAWFDVFMPQRNIHWSDSSAFTILNYCSEYQKYVENFLPTDRISNTYVMGILADWFDSLGSLYATCDPNYFTSAVRNLNPTAQADIHLENPLSDISDQPNVVAEAFASQGAVPQSYTDGAYSGTAITRLQLQLVNTLSKYINTNTVIGQRLDAFFKAHFDGYTGKNEESTFAGASVTDIMLGDTIVTASTSDAKAGDFAGVGFGKGNYKMSYKAKEFGYFIVFGAVIPVSNYVQGTSYDSFLTRPLEFPHPEFDSLGYDMVRKGEVISPAVRDGRLSVRPDAYFGYQPRYTGHKVMPSVMMGEPAFLSSRDQWLGFSLDNIMSGGFTTIEGFAVEPSAGGYAGSNTYNLYNIPDSVLTAGTWWRYLGKYDWMGNYDRIFYDNNLAQGRKLSSPLLAGGRESYASVGTVPRSDGFILYQDHDVNYIAPLNSIGNSYDTIEGDNYVNHE